MERLSLACLCLLTWSGMTSADGNGRVVVEEGSDALLPCSLSTKEDIKLEVFDWKKDGQEEVFLYDAGLHYNNGRTGQDEQFKGRVSHFQDELKLGNASIIIRSTKVADSGSYTCVFPHLQPRQTFHIELVVGAAHKPSVTILDQTRYRSVLQCEVEGAFPKPKVEFNDSSGNIVPAHEPQVSERGGGYDVTLQATVNKTDTFRCVVTQEEIDHQVYADIYVFLPPPPDDDQTSSELRICFSAEAVLGVFVVLLLCGAGIGFGLAWCGKCCYKVSKQHKRAHAAQQDTEFKLPPMSQNQPEDDSSPDRRETVTLN